MRNWFLGVVNVGRGFVSILVFGCCWFACGSYVCFYGCVVVQCEFVWVSSVFGVRLVLSFSNARAVGRTMVGSHFRYGLRFRHNSLVGRIVVCIDPNTHV